MAMKDYKQDILADKFFKQNHLLPSYIHYDDVKTFVKAKKLAYNHLVSEHDKKVFNKFCRTWILHKGVLPQKRVRRIQSMIKYYAQKEQDYILREKRLTRKYKVV